MQRAQQNDQVTILYNGKLASGETFESSDDTGPLSFQIGDQSVMPAFEQAVIGMAAGESKTITLAPEEAYGTRREELVLEVPRDTFGPREISRGMVLGLTMEQEGKPVQMPATVVAVADTSVTVDFNHPLAGQTLTFSLTLQAIAQPATGGCSGCAPKTGGCAPSSCKGCS
ncbi:MAG TPA: peptidylprolyl isomerase [Desulfurivibrionaceae bacterium]|nr:peptidylprolyl isomerase [Desulfurivibrionaceae bacterium]